MNSNILQILSLCSEVQKDFNNISEYSTGSLLISFPHLKIELGAILDL